MTAAWPATLPQFVEANARETTPQGLLESQIANGEPQARERSRGINREHDVAILCDATQVGDFETFYITTLKGGVLPFTWVNPRTQVAGTFRFRLPPPSYAPRISGVLTLVSFKLMQVL